jgi:hypothetical protein
VAVTPDKRRGSIINVVSSGVLSVAAGGGYHGLRPWTVEMPYQATKAAVTAPGRPGHCGQPRGGPDRGQPILAVPPRGPGEHDHEHLVPDPQPFHRQRSGTRRRSLDARWRLDGWHIGIRLDAGSDVDTAALRAEVVAALAEQGLSPAVVEHGEGWSAWTTSAEEPAPADVEAHAAAVRRAQRELSATSASPSAWAGRTTARPASRAPSVRPPTPRASP